jgi:hypothetical protein
VCTLGTADSSTLEMAALSIRKVEASSGHKSLIRGCIFDIPSNELEPYLEREHRYIAFQTEVIDHQVQFGVRLIALYLERTSLMKNNVSFDNCHGTLSCFRRIVLSSHGQYWRIQVYH